MATLVFFCQEIVEIYQLCVEPDQLFHSSGCQGLFLLLHAFQHGESVQKHGPLVLTRPRPPLELKHIIDLRVVDKPQLQSFRGCVTLFLVERGKEKKRGRETRTPVRGHFRFASSFQFQLILHSVSVGQISIQLSV